MSDEKVTWAERVRTLQSSGMTFADIGRAIGMSVSGVSDVANGHTGAPIGDAAVALDGLYRKAVRRAARAAR